MEGKSSPLELLKAAVLLDGGSLEDIFNVTGISVIQHKHRRVNFGGVGSKPRLLTLSDDATRLTLMKRENAELRASVDDLEEEMAYSKNIAQIEIVHEGTYSKEMQQSLKKREKSGPKVEAASRRCFSIQWKGERGTWNLEVDPRGAAGSVILGADAAAALRDVLVAFLTSAAGSIELGDSAEAHEPKIFGSSTGSRAHGQKGNKKGAKKGGKKAGDAQTFRLRKLSITANDAAELEGVLEEIKAEDEVEKKPKALGIVKDGDLYLAREKKEGRLEDQDVNLALDAKLPFGAEICGLFSCHGVEPKFTRTGFEVKGKINQDRGGMQWPFGGRSDCAFFAVMDGHGRNGEKISEHCMRHLPKLLQASPFLHSDPGKALKKAFLDVDAQLRKQLGRDSTYAGTTCVVVLAIGNDLWIGNAGDSRAVVCAVDPTNDDFVVAKDLSLDQKPDLPTERQRVVKMGGFVSDESEEEGPARVWLTRSMDSCGLSMARSLGDHALARVGVIAEPEVTHHALSPDDKYLVLGSDGIWEFLSSQQAAEVVHDVMQGKAPNPASHSGGKRNSNEPARAAEACRKLCELSSNEWQRNEGDYRDDITGIVCRLPCFPCTSAQNGEATPGAGIKI